MKKIELLAPAGNIEKLKFAFMYGADACYIGGRDFSLRANAKNFSLEEMKEAGLASFYAEHEKAVYPTDANGVPFTVTYFATTGDPLADLSEDMAAEEKARVTYEHLMDLTDDPDILGPLVWLRQREVVHFARFKELYDYYKNNNVK